MLASVLHVHNAVGECKAVARWLQLFIAEVPLLDVCHLGTRVLSKYLHVSIIDGELSKGVDWSNYPVYYPKKKK